MASCSAPCLAMPKSHSQGEYVFDHGWADAFERAGGRYYQSCSVGSLHARDRSPPARPRGVDEAVRGMPCCGPESGGRNGSAFRRRMSLSPQET